MKCTPEKIGKARVDSLAKECEKESGYKNRMRPTLPGARICACIVDMEPHATGSRDGESCVTFAAGTRIIQKGGRSCGKTGGKGDGGPTSGI